MEASPMSSTPRAPPGQMAHTQGPSAAAHAHSAAAGAVPLGSVQVSQKTDRVR